MYNEDYRPRGSLCSFDFGIGEILSAVLPAVIGAGTTIGSKFIGGGGGGGGGSSDKSAAMTPAAIPKPSATSTVTGSAVAPGTSAADFTQGQNAWWQQLLSGTGQTAGGALPEGIQQNIEKQASLL